MFAKSNNLKLISIKKALQKNHKQYIRKLSQRNLVPNFVIPNSSFFVISHMLSISKSC